MDMGKGGKNGDIFNNVNNKNKVEKRKKFSMLVSSYQLYSLLRQKLYFSSIVFFIILFLLSRVISIGFYASCNFVT